MNHEQPPQQPDQPADTPHPSFDADEQVGDIYEVDIGPDGIERVEKLREHNPHIWVGSLSDYNDGILHGTWIDAAREVDDIHRDIDTMLEASPTAARSGQPAEEWGIFDHEGFGAYRVEEHTSIETVSRIARGIAEHGPAFAAYADAIGAEPELLDRFEDAYLGHYESAAAFAEQLIDDLGYDHMLDEAAPRSLRPYVRIDTDALTRDLELSGDIAAVAAEDGGVWIFDARQRTSRD